jgi:16S rRNA (cytidine1402-2'-O)-methyltransferase
VPLAVCATPIGNLEDVTLRVLRELGEADLVLCEDTRRTRRLLERHGIGGARLLSYHEHNEAKRVGEFLPRLEAGERIALVSDAGLPGINDPGARLVKAALDAGVPVSASSASGTSSLATSRGEKGVWPRFGPSSRDGLGRPSPSSRPSGFPRRSRAWPKRFRTGRCRSAAS